MSIQDYLTRQLRWSPVALFRFSALTLNLINMIEYWRDVHSTGHEAGEITYMAKSPIYAGETYQIRTGEVIVGEGRRKLEILVEKNGVLCMKGEISSTA
jgi:hypothetical protein